MKLDKFLLRVLQLAVVAFGLVAVARAQSDGPSGVPLKIWAQAYGRAVNGEPADVSVSGGGFLAIDPVSGGGTDLWVDGNRVLSTYSWYATSKATVQAEAGKVYYLAVSGVFNQKNALSVIAPAGYQVEIDGAIRTYLESTGNNHTYVVRLLSPMDEMAGRAGSASSIASNKVSWQVSLGALKNGGSARSLAIIDAGTSASWSTLFTPAGLQYTEPSTEVSVYRVTNQIRQIVANEATVDVVTLSATSYELRFYNPSQVVGSTWPRTFTGNPYVTYRIEQGASATELKITSTTLDLAAQATARTAVTVLTRTGAWPGFTWNLQDWNTSGQAQQTQEIRQSGGTTANRTESIAVSVPGGATATQTSRAYALQAWGEVLGSETRGTSNGLTTAYDYYTDAAQPGSYAYIKSMVAPGGSWEAYEYYDAAANSNRTGTVKYKYRPYLNAPAGVTLDPNQGEVTYFEYTADAFGMLTRPTLVQTSVNGAVIAKAVTSYIDKDAAGNPVLTANGLWVVEASRSDYTDATGSLSTIIRYYREDTFDEFFRSQVHAVTRPDGVKQSFAYQRGTWNGSSFVKSTNNGLDTGPTSRVAVLTGTSASGTYYSTYDGYALDPLYLLEGKSTMEVTIRDDRALVVRTESYAWKNATWNLVAGVSYAYDTAGLLVGKTTSNGGQYTAAYSGEQKQSETDESGITVSYTYDPAGRVQAATKSSGPTTTFAYDAEDRALSETVGAVGTGETIYTARHYDDAGRLDSETPAGLGATSYSYNVAGRSRTATYPDGGTRTEHYLLDGHMDYVDGTATVPQYYSYGFDAAQFRTIQVFSGASNSPRWQKATTDWLGRPVETRRPGFSITGQGDYVEGNTYESGTGRLLKTTRSGLAPTKYEYDALSNVVRTGLDIGDDGLVNTSVDRISESDQYFESDASGWWLRQETRTYPKANDPTMVTTSVTRKRLTGHPAGRLDETQVTDAEGNTVTRTVDVNRGTATATITTVRPGVANHQIETIVNGLATTATGHDGLAYTTEYDPLSRVWRTKDPRNNYTTTSYKYGSALVSGVADGAGNTVSIVSYDGMGRRQWVQDAAGQYTRFAYNQRGQLTNQWGGGSYPVAYGYDATYGDRTTLSTYRSAPAADSASWPAVGVADTTTWSSDAATGLLWKKTDAATQVTEFDYNVRGQTATRRWARALVSNAAIKLACSYTYDGNTGELLGTTYNDGADPIPTPAVGYTYTRLGQVATVSDGTGTRTFNYNSGAPWRLDNEALDAGFYAARVLTREYNTSSGTGGSYGPYTPGFVTGRYQGFDLGVAGNTTRDFHQNYTWSDLGRFVGVNTRTTTGAARDYVYNYQAGSALVGGYVMGSLTVSRGYEAQRDLLTSLETKWGTGAATTRYDYTYNALGQRRTAKQSGSAFADYYSGQAYSATYNVYNYNARGELQTAAMYRGDSPSVSPASADELPGHRFEYRYDSLGNRLTAGSTGSANTADDEYQANALNQYVTKENNTVKVLGTASASAKVAVKGAPATGKTDRAWGADLVPANTAGPVQATVTVYAALPGGGSGGADLIRTDGKGYFAAPALQHFSYDADGNLTGDEVWSYTYNAENQLVRMQSVLPAGYGFARLRVDFKYDYMGRRVEKAVYDLNNGSVQTLARRFLYDGWNLIAETDIAGNLQRTFTWGLDLAGSLTATGGVGALLQIHDLAAGKTLAAAYDGNGNVAALLNADTGALEAAYEYDPYGNLLRSEGAYAKANPFRFSTKWQDDETGLLNYGFRYYSPTLGRFINRDPIAEKGGLNLYGFCRNDGVNGIDYLGHSWLSKAFKSVGKFFKKYGSTIINVAFTLVGMPIVGALIGTAFDMAFNGMTLKQAALGFIIGATVGKILGPLAGKIGASFGKLVGNVIGGALIGGTTGGILSAINGGSFVEGFAGGAIVGGAVGGVIWAGQQFNFGQKLGKVLAPFRGAESAINGVFLRAKDWVSGARLKATSVQIGEPKFIEFLDDGPSGGQLIRETAQLSGDIPEVIPNSAYGLARDPAGRLMAINPRTGKATVVPSKMEASFTAGFADQAKLIRHFNDHAADFGALTPQDYENLARDFMTGDPAFGVLEKVRLNGDTVRFNPATDYFGVITRDNVIRTFYKPNPAIHGMPSNLDYFDNQ